MADLPAPIDASASWPRIEALAATTPEAALDALGTRPAGLTSAEVTERTETFGPNAVRSHHSSA